MRDFEPIRRSISGIYILDKFPHEKKEHPTCIEDCQEQTRRTWLNSLSITELWKTEERIYKVLLRVIDVAADGTNDFDEIKEKLKEERKKHPRTTELNKDSLIEYVNLNCRSVRMLADMFDVQTI